MRDTSRRLSEAVGVPVHVTDVHLPVVDAGRTRYANGFYAGGEIWVDLAVAALLDPFRFRAKGRGLRKQSMAIWTLAHEWGHAIDDINGTINQPDREESANRHAYRRFRKLCLRLGATRQQTVSLWMALPSWYRHPEQWQPYAARAA